jgi:hypothetical protein
MFSTGDKDEQNALAEALTKAGFECHVPHRDGIEVAAVMKLLNDPSNHIGTMLEPFVLSRCIAWVTRTVVALDVYEAIEDCQCTVINIDGRIPDEGSLVEATLAWYAGSPVIRYQTTSIRELGGNNNPMIGVISDWPPDLGQHPRADVVTAVKQAVSAQGFPQPVTPPPANVKQLVDLGRVIAGIRAQPPLDSAQQAAAVQQLAAVPPSQMERLEPVASLQEKCREVVVVMIEFSKHGPGAAARRTQILQSAIADLQKWVARPGIRDAILKNEITC